MKVNFLQSTILLKHLKMEKFNIIISLQVGRIAVQTGQIWIQVVTYHRLALLPLTGHCACTPDLLTLPHLTLCVVDTLSVSSLKRSATTEMVWRRQKMNQLSAACPASKMAVHVDQPTGSHWTTSRPDRSQA